jgi:dodecin
MDPVEAPSDCEGRTRRFTSIPCEEALMSSIVKVVEVIAQSEKSFDDAVEQALQEAAQTIDDIKEIWVSGQKAIVENNRIVEYRVTTKISFLVKGHR